MVNLINQYGKLPIQGRYGCGNYTYALVISFDNCAIHKYEIFANSLEQALGFASSLNFTWSAVREKGDSVLELFPIAKEINSCYLYLA